VWSWGLAFYGLGVYLVALGRQHGWSISAISVAITAFYLMGAGATASVGAVMRRFGGHRVVVGGVLAMALGVAALGSIDRLWQLYAALAAMALGWACMSGAAINIVVAPWFIRQRGVAVSLALTGASGGGVLVAPALLALVTWWGFPAAVRTAALVMVLTAVPVAMLVFRRTPESLGVGPDGDPPLPPAVPAIMTSRAPRATPFRTRRYWTISLAFALGLAAQVGVLTHLVSYLTPRLGAAGAGAALSLATVAAIAGRVPMGALADRLDRRTIAALNFLLQVAGLVLLVLDGSSAVMYGGCILFGFGVGNTITLPGLLVESEFPREQFASIVSVVTATNQVAFAFAPALVGILRDATGGYLASLTLCAAADLVAATVVILGRPRLA
jgi:MFS family permease